MVDIAKPNFNNGLWASGGAIVAPSNTKIATGWTAEVPPFQWENYSQNRQDQGIAHILQHGIAYWDSLTEYQGGKSYVQGSDGLIYRAVQTNTGQNPVTDTSNVYWNKNYQSGILLATRVFDSSGTYVPTPGATYAIADVQGAGGQGGGSPAGTATQLGFGTGGHSGSRLVGKFSVVGVTSLSVVVGLGGTTGVAGAAGQQGGLSSVGTLISCSGGAGGGIVGPTAGPSIIANASAYPQPSATGAVTVILAQPGNGGTAGQAISGGIGISGIGAASPGYGGNISGNIGTGTGSPGTQRGQGGSGAFSAINAAVQKGGDGAPGKIIIWEYA